jgi:hypothetical protein
MDVEHTEAFWAGCASAQYSGLKCPYENGSTLEAAWSEGWDYGWSQQ